MDHLTNKTGNSVVESEGEDSESLQLFASAAFCLAVAVAVHIPTIWESVADPSARGRRSGMKHLLANIGQWPISVTFGILCMALVFFAWPSRRR
jgi:hypothetical protein